MGSKRTEGLNINTLLDESGRIITTYVATKVHFEEHGYAPGQHVLPVLSMRVGHRDKKHLSSSSRIVAVQTHSDEASEHLLGKDVIAEKKKKEKLGATAVPLAILPSGNVLRDRSAASCCSLNSMKRRRLLACLRHILYSTFFILC